VAVFRTRKPAAVLSSPRRAVALRGSRKGSQGSQHSIASFGSSQSRECFGCIPFSALVRPLSSARLRECHHASRSMENWRVIFTILTRAFKSPNGVRTDRRLVLLANHAGCPQATRRWFRRRPLVRTRHLGPPQSRAAEPSITLVLSPSHSHRISVAAFCCRRDGDPRIECVCRRHDCVARRGLHPAGHKPARRRPLAGDACEPRRPAGAGSGVLEGTRKSLRQFDWRHMSPAEAGHCRGMPVSCLRVVSAFRRTAAGPSNELVTARSPRPCIRCD
jgi:hypothetical protein